MQRKRPITDITNVQGYAIMVLAKGSLRPLCQLGMSVHKQDVKNLNIFLLILMFTDMYLENRGGYVIPQIWGNYIRA